MSVNSSHCHVWQLIGTLPLPCVLAANTVYKHHMPHMHLVMLFYVDVFFMQEAARQQVMVPCSSNTTKCQRMPWCSCCSKCWRKYKQAANQGHRCGTAAAASTDGSMSTCTAAGIGTAAHIASTANDSRGTCRLPIVSQERSHCSRRQKRQYQQQQSTPTPAS